MPRRPLVVLTELGTRRGRLFADALQRLILEYRDRHEWFPCVLDLSTCRREDLPLGEEVDFVIDSDEARSAMQRLAISDPLMVISGSRGQENTARSLIVTDPELIGALGADHLLRAGHRRFAFIASEASPNHEKILAEFVREIDRIDATDREVTSCLVDDFQFDLRSNPAGFFTLDEAAHRFLLEAFADCDHGSPRNFIQPSDFSTTGDLTFRQIVRDPVRTAEAVVAKLVAKDEDASNELVYLPVKLPSVFPTPSTQDASVQEVSALIDERIDEPDLSAQMLAQHLEVSRRTVERRFREVLGNSILQEIQRRRILKAKVLLTTFRHKPDFVAQSCGFSSSRMLAIAFKRFTDVKPRAYQKAFLSRSAAIF